MSLWSESVDPALGKLQQQVRTLDAQKANFQQTIASLQAELAEAKTTHKEDVYRLQEVETRAVAAEEKLRKKTDELKQSLVQKSNSQQACLALEKQLKEEKDEVKRMTYELEVVSSRSNSAAPSSRVAEEKVALERQVEQLSADLKKAEAALEKETENVSAKQSSRGSTGSSRTSISPADQANSQRNRFGFGAPAKGRASLLPDPSATPARPGSALSSHSNIPAPSTAISKRRRSSSFSGIPTSNAVATSSAPRIAQLERELTEAKAKVESAETDFLNVKTKLAGKERELLNIENRMMALDRTKGEEIESLKNKLEDAFDDVAEKKQEAALIRDTLRGEMDKMVKEGREEKSSLLAKIERMKVELEKREAELERSEVGREEIEQQLGQAKEDDKLARAKISKSLEEAHAAKADLERQVARLSSELKQEASKEAARERMEEELGNVKNELDEVRARTTKAIDDLRNQKDVAERAREAESSKRTTRSGNDEDKKRLEKEIEDVKQHLAAAEDRIREFESRDVVEAAVARSEVETVERELNEAKEGAQTLEEAKQVLVEQVEAFGQRELEWSEREKELSEAVSGGQAELSAVKTELETLRTEMAGNSSTEELTSELANIQAQLATKESDIVHLTSRLASAEQSHATALAESKSALDAANCATERLNTTVQDLQRERDTLSSSLASLETQLSAVTSSHSDELALSTSALEKAESLKLTLDSTILSLQQERDATATDLTRVNAALDSLRAEKDEADRLAPVHQQELVALEGALQQRDARITELETSAAAQTDAPTRSFDDSHVEAVEKRLAEAEERATDLSKQLGEMEEYESLRTEQQRELERKVEGLEQTIAELQEDLETLDNSSREELSRAGEDTDTARRLVEEAEIRIEHAETSLADREATIASLVEKNEQLESTIVDLELSTAHLPELEELLATASAELDTLRSTTEEGSLAAMQEASDLQARITTQESEIDDLKQHLSSLDTLRLTLTQEQDKVTALSQDLARAKEEASAVDISSANRLAALTTRAERAEEDVHRLRSKLDETTARLLDSKDLLAQSQADLQLVSSRDASPVPSPTTPTFSSNDASILVSRLREERDDLRTRLDFARTEAAYRVQALQERLKETEDAKAKEVSAMEVQLVERTAELGAEREGRIAAEEREQEAEKDVQALDDELARAEEKVREVEMRLDELTASLQAELDEAHHSLDASSREAITFREAAEESQRALAEATARVQELENALEASERTDDGPSTPTPELVELCASLQKEVTELQARVLRRTETIGRHEQTIAQLQNRLADSDDDDHADTAEIAPRIPTSSVDTTELANAKAQLEEEEQIRADLEEQLHLVTEDLDEARGQLLSSQAATQEAERELQAALEAESVLDDQLRDVTTHLESVEAAHHALQADYDGLLPRHEQLDTAHQDLQVRLNTLQLAHSQAVDRVGSLEDDLSVAEERRAEALGELESARASFEALRPSLSVMEARLEDAITDKHALEQQVAEREGVVASLRRSVVALEQAKVKLAEDLEAATSVVQLSMIEYGRVAQMEEELEGLRVALTSAEARLAEVQSSREALEVSYQALEKELETVATLQTGDVEELSSVKDELAFASSRIAELDTLCAEAQQNLGAAQQDVAVLTSRLSTTEADLLQARIALDTSASTLATVQQQLDEQVAAGQRHEEETVALWERLNSASADLTAAREDSCHRTAQLEEELNSARSQLADTLQAMDANEQGARAEMDEVTHRLEHLTAEKNSLSVALSQAQDDVAGLKVQLEDSSRGSAQVVLLETQLHEAQREIEGLGELVQSERDALKVQKEAVGKVESARDAAMRENKTLRQLARGAEAEVEGLKNENARLDKVAAALEQDNLSLDARLRNIEETSQAHLTELLDTLQLAEERKAEVERQVVALEQQIGELEASLAAAPSSQQPDITELEETIKQLSQQLEAKDAEVEDTDEKYMEVLKSQKRHLSQIERLKAKISSLQRDLTNAKAAAAPPPPTTPAPAPAPAPASIAPGTSRATVEPSSAGKKRQAPQDFDPLPSATATPRAIVALTSRPPSSAPRTVEKENSISRPRSDSASKRKPAPSADGLIPLKPAAISPPPREALKVVESNGVATDVKPPSKVDELRARLAAQRQARPQV